ncbi:MAG: phosphatidate cytidylyltransferase, partial [Candidatus Marinimicrobia bacterium]|nr:phosphatidate cytidylyltransferase [Candidatus Neomarinimicrobiota bacterium]
MKYRLMVGVVGIPGLLLLIWLGSWPYFALVAVVTLIGTHEYLKMLRADNLATRDIPLYLGATALLILAAQEGGLLSISWMPGYAGGAMLLTVLLMFTLQIWDVVRSPGRAWLGMGAHMVGFIWIAGCMSSFILIRQITAMPGSAMHPDIGFRLTLSLFVSVWVCDSAAYFFGKTFGKAKIAPQVSPNKTVLGTAAGLLAAVVTMQLFAAGDWLPGLDVADYLVLGIITGA